MNMLINFPSFTRLYDAVEDDPEELLLLDEYGDELTLVRRFGTFDVRKEKMRKIFVDNAKYAMASGVINGGLEKFLWEFYFDTIEFL